MITIKKQYATGSSDNNYKNKNNTKVLQMYVCISMDKYIRKTLKNRQRNTTKTKIK